MPHFFKRWPLVIVIVLAILLIVLTILTSGQRDNLTKVEGVVGDIIAPAQGFMYRIATSVSQFFQSIKEKQQLSEQYEILKERVTQLEQQQLEMDEILRENQRLNRLLEFKEQKHPFIVEGVRITGKNPGNWFNTLTIDKGSNDQITVNMAVVNDQGLIGRVIDAGGNWATVRTIIDGQSSVSAIIERTRDNGMVKGNNSLTFEDGLCRMINLPLDSDVVAGDRVITSGLGEIFPKGIPIGEVTEVLQEERDMYKTAIVRPHADFLHLEEVLVIRRADE
ncbi:MAG: rod shape-determining protein MreC [Caldicoprobacterales bacterium]|nr:rod shape-determining protein MreC [Clostridiales bacterium]